MKKTVLISILTLCFFLCACSLSGWLATATPPPPTPDRLATEPIPQLPSFTPAPSLAPVTKTPEPLPVVYYFFVPTASGNYPAGSVVILQDVLILGPTLSRFPRSSDPVANTAAALHAMLQDSRNAWKSSGLTIADLSLVNGAAVIGLQGDFQAPGDIVLIAARMQILLTVFTEPAVQTAVVTVNGQNIANLGISHASQAKPDHYAFTRAEIEQFMAANAK